MPGLKGEPTLEKITAHWQSFLARLKEESLPTCIILSSGVPASFDNNTLTVGFDRRHRFHKEQSQEKTNADRIEKTFESYFGSEIRFKARTVESTEPPEENREEKPLPARTAPTEKPPNSIIDLVQTQFPDSRQI
ncbi:MAG: hypothetical protein ABIH66_05340 [bacterium]